MSSEGATFAFFDPSSPHQFGQVQDRVRPSRRRSSRTTSQAVSATVADVYGQGGGRLATTALRCWRQLTRYHPLLAVLNASFPLHTVSTWSPLVAASVCAAAGSAVAGVCALLVRAGGPWVDDVAVTGAVAAAAVTLCTVVCVAVARCERLREPVVGHIHTHNSTHRCAYQPVLTHSHSHGEPSTPHAHLRNNHPWVNSDSSFVMSFTS